MAEISKELQGIEDNKALAKLANGNKTQYIRNKVFKYNEQWWESVMMDMKSEDHSIRRVAQTEFNKLQCRVLPTEFSSGEEGDGIVLKVVSYQQPKDKDKD